MNVQQLAFWYVLFIPIVAGVSTLEFKTGGEFTLTGVVWALQALVGIVLFVVGLMRGGFQVHGRAWTPWMFLTGWIWASLIWNDDITRRSIQEATQLSMPLLVGMIAEATITSRVHLRRLILACGLTFALVAVYACFAFGSDDEWIRERIRPAALTAALLGCLFLGFFPKRLILPLLGWGACVAITTVTESRMATMSLLVAPVLHPGYRSKLTNLWMVAAVSVLGVALFYAPVFQQRFFPDGGGTVSEVAKGDFSGAGRFDAWPIIKAKAWQRPILGWGVGFGYEYVPTIWEDTRYPHNDYLRFFFEQGLIGVGLFIFAGIWQGAVLYRYIKYSQGIVRSAFTGCFLGFGTLYISCATDNTILYNIYFTNVLFAVLGGAYGVAWPKFAPTEEVADDSEDTPSSVHPLRLAVAPAFGEMGHSGGRSAPI